jgi:thioredoxin-like negative regulator of GroEL
MGCQAMAPVVHGLEQQFAGKVDFLYLNVADARNEDARRTLGFESTPHFFFLRQDGSPVSRMEGVVPADSLRRALDRLLTERPSPTPR